MSFAGATTERMWSRLDLKATRSTSAETPETWDSGAMGVPGP